MALRASKLRDLRIHHIHEIRDAARDMFRQRVGRLVHGRQKQRIETVLNRHRIASHEA